MANFYGKELFLYENIEVNTELKVVVRSGFISMFVRNPWCTMLHITCWWGVVIVVVVSFYFISVSCRLRKCLGFDLNGNSVSETPHSQSLCSVNLVVRTSLQGSPGSELLQPHYCIFNSANWLGMPLVYIQNQILPLKDWSCLASRRTSHHADFCNVL